MADVAPRKEPHRPQPGDVVICDVEESEELNQSYWVRTQSRDNAATLFDGPDAWAKARAAADERVGDKGTIWRFYKDGRFERVSSS
jgi:hypothetical protein